MKKDTGEDDFDRNVWCLLGLMFDEADLDHARDSIYSAAAANKPLFITTPNLNFTIAALGDLHFRETVINSDLSLIDGMPLLWISKILGTSITSKASGSDLFDKLWHQGQFEGRKIKVFFFGGEDGISKQACQIINNTTSGLTCVGFLNPGFGSISEISSQTIIDQINVSKADFLVVSLGAKKGQTWIFQNRKRLRVPVVSHLGAVVNFVAGSIRRAPVLMQRLGLEWVWRILQEPMLWKRYFFDGLKFIILIFTRVLPYALWRMTHARLLADKREVNYELNNYKNQIVIKLHGSCLYHTVGPLREALRDASLAGKPVKLDLTDVPVIDGAFLGLCLVMLKHVKSVGSEISFSGLNPNLERIFRWNCVEFLL